MPDVTIHFVVRLIQNTVNVSLLVPSYRDKVKMSSRCLAWHRVYWASYIIL